jgi:aryl-alcohol dehydrogenase-like predicted oxidoreductase
VKLLSYGSLNGGFLSGKYLGGGRPEGARHSKSPEFQHRYAGPRVEVAAEKYKALATRKGLSLTQLCISWCASKATHTNSRPVTRHPIAHDAVNP